MRSLLLEEQVRPVYHPPPEEVEQRILDMQKRLGDTWDWEKTTGAGGNHGWPKDKGVRVTGSDGREWRSIKDCALALAVGQTTVHRAIAGRKPIHGITLTIKK
jgi:hypothetical protein